MMRTNMNSIASFLFTILAVLLVLLVAGCVPSRLIPQANLPVNVQDVPGGDVEAQVDDNIPIETTKNPAENPTTLQQDGHSILKSRCTQCHLVRELEGIEQSRDEWELALSYMEKFGVQLSDDEKVTLVDYLAVVDEK